MSDYWIEKGHIDGKAMSDIVGRLRRKDFADGLLFEAADVIERLVKIEIAWQQAHEAVLRRNRFLESEIERLSACVNELMAKNAELKAALRSISQNDCAQRGCDVHEIALTALVGEQRG